MDSILFYGDRGEASRRQVRSAAAQHSHRIGPRKPKSSKKTKTDTASTTKKRPLKANNFVSHGPADLEKRAAKGRPSTSANGSFSSSSSTPPSATAAVATNQGALSSPASTPSHEHNDAKRQHSFRFKEGRGDERPRMPQPSSSSDAPTPSYSTGPAPTQAQAPLPPPLVIERIPQAVTSTASHSRQSSGASTVSPSTRLPQYSWTEYPRYGLSHTAFQSSLQTLAQAAVESSDQRFSPVPSRGGSVPESSPSTTPLSGPELARSRAVLAAGRASETPPSVRGPALSSASTIASFTATALAAESAPAGPAPTPPSARSSASPGLRRPSGTSTWTPANLPGPRPCIGEPKRTGPTMIESRELPRLDSGGPNGGGANVSSFADFLRSTADGRQYIDDLDRRRSRSSAGSEGRDGAVKQEVPPEWR
ncbi:hypothetical protein M409DRAFT_55266 [Zasmidium cellare ATCC 36951]|uniref:Uncharacterized protein n=1 Tax=Zasmidium cellare ATCC 36951 TaxID=1080233 RepID=A0A6A6CGW8_ZASCE|nr:uncharacterized protein M409DRAFT_55266 [Zasmidium cellare ATCC 36951]KAF2165893.1 hypothetical protein M409DRAFT_55266 [Zasmidium cellare ATCC 36951]